MVKHKDKEMQLLREARVTTVLRRDVLMMAKCVRVYLRWKLKGRVTGPQPKLPQTAGIRVQRALESTLLA